MKGGTMIITGERNKVFSKLLLIYLLFPNPNCLSDFEKLKQHYEELINSISQELAFYKVTY